ncbi:MAG: hypothetical protein CM15mP32_1270 [Flavobacteriaceae bacterium]|nr:MAG: hypothetical protein CM15mP32_1270 [Flavobacteriaceae bacterium]
MDRLKLILVSKIWSTLSGIKAHTIRIWEKDTIFLNRTNRDKHTSLQFDSLQKLLNVSCFIKMALKFRKLRKWRQMK